MPLFCKFNNLIFVSCIKCSQDKVYQENLEASVAVLKKLSDQWKEHSAKLAPFDPMRETLKSFRHKVTLFFLLFGVRE